MDKGRFKELADNPGLIPAIYNYCDRWCERCLLTAHCAVFAIEEAESSSGSRANDENRAFWQQLKETLEAALELLGDIAQKTGVDLDTLVSEEDKVSRIRNKKGSGEQALVQQAKEYMISVGRWFESTNMKTQCGLLVVDSKPEVENLREIEQIILWYHTLIYAKIARAVQYKIEGQPASFEDMPKDSDGSAKVALTAIDRSMAAWWRMRGYFPKRKDRIVECLLRLDRLRRATERAFHNARSFVRPGFDEE
jgi:hypothetical protein